MFLNIVFSYFIMSKKISFAHLADLHLGGWREKSLTNLNFITFKSAIDRVIELDVDFVLFAGDIFNNAIPPLDLVDKVVKEFMRFKEKNIPLYVIGGSHDYSNSGKSFISLLESAGVFVDVSKYEIVDSNKVKLKFEKFGNVVISGILGRKNGLDKNIYSNLTNENLSKENFNIFMFHTTLNDFKPDFMKAVKSEVTKSYLPTGFDYYAGGHIHTFMKGEYSTGILSYPGPLFPNNFSELKREECSFNLCEFDFSDRSIDIKRIFIKKYEKEIISIEINNLDPISAKEKIFSEIEKKDLSGKIVLLEIFGVVDGKISDLKMSEIVSLCYNKSSYVVLKNTYKLTSSYLSENIETNLSEDSSEIENEIIESLLKDSTNKICENDFMKKLLSLDLEKIEGEKINQYEQRITLAIEKSLNS